MVRPDFDVIYIWLEIRRFDVQRNIYLLLQCGLDDAYKLY